VSVTQAAFGTGTQFTITFGGSLATGNLNQIVAEGAGGPVTSVSTVQDGLAGSVTVTGASPFTVDFGGDLAKSDLPQMTAANVSGNASATVTTTRDGAGVLVSETPSVNGKLLTVTFLRPLNLAIVPQLAAVNVSA